MTAKTYSLGVDGMEGYIFVCGRHNDAAIFNETQKGISNYTLQSLEKGGTDVAKTFHTLEFVEMKTHEVTEEDKAITDLDKKIWTESWQSETRRVTQYLNWCKLVYAVVVKLCRPCLMISLEGTAGFTGVKGRGDLVSLIILIQGICCCFNDHHQAIWNVV